MEGAGTGSRERGRERGHTMENGETFQTSAVRAFAIAATRRDATLWSHHVLTNGAAEAEEHAF